MPAVGVGEGEGATVGLGEGVIVVAGDGLAEGPAPLQAATRASRHRSATARDRIERRAIRSAPRLAAAAPALPPAAEAVPQAGAAEFHGLAAPPLVGDAALPSQ